MALLVLIIYTRVRVRLCELRARIYDRACVRVRIYVYMCMQLYPREFAFVYMQKCKRSFLRAYACIYMRACLRADLIKTQNAFACKIFQHSNALWVQKLSGCTILPEIILYIYMCTLRTLLFAGT